LLIKNPQPVSKGIIIIFRIINLFLIIKEPFLKGFLLWTNIKIQSNTILAKKEF